MSLIKCPDCGKNVSNQAISCPNCGYPISKEAHILKNLNIQKKYNSIIIKERTMKIFGIIAIISIIFWVILFLWQQGNMSDIIHAKASSYARSISGSYMSEKEEELLRLNDIINIIKNILFFSFVLFFFLFLHFYDDVKRLKNLPIRTVKLTMPIMLIIISLFIFRLAIVNGMVFFICISLLILVYDIYIIVNSIKKYKESLKHN